MDPIIARKLARTANPYPSVVFLAPEAAAAYAAAGLPPGQAGYFAGRAAPMGAVTAEVVIATFYSFAPELIRSCIPVAWSAASPEVILGHRLISVDAALRRILRARGLIDGDGVATEAGRAHREAVEGQTDLLALAPLESLGEEGCLRLRELIRPMSVAIAGHLLPQ